MVLKRRTAPVANGGFLPTDISGLQLWLDANDISTLWTDSAGTDQVDADGDVVGRWDDKSSSTEFLQSTTSKKPLYKTDQQNSLPSILFDGIDDGMDGVFSMNQPFTMFVVVDRTDGAGLPQGRLLDTVGSPSRVLVDVGRLLPADLKPKINAGVNLAGATSVPVGFWLFSVKIDGATSEIFFNSVSDNTGDAGANDIVTPMSLCYAGANFSPLSVAEMLFYDSILSLDDMGLVDSYINSKWGLF